MSMETTITRAWQRQALWLWLLLPVSCLYGLLIKLRRQAYKSGLFASYRPPVALMVIGNISVGGSGKTPLIISLVSYLQQQGVQVAVISRGYGGDSRQMPALVTANSLPSDVGDEPCLIVNMTGVAMAVCPNRQQAVELLLEAYPTLQLIIADDGLQHYALQRDIEWIVVDAARGFGNQQLLPTGFLREPIARLKEATVIYHQKPDEPSINDDKSQSKHLTMQLQPNSLQPLFAEDAFNKNAAKNNNKSAANPTNYDSQQACEVTAVAPIAGDTVHAVSGIGYPQRFFTSLESLGFSVIAHPYPDHHNFSLDELLQYQQQPIVVTSKDAVKIRALLAALIADQSAPASALKVAYQSLASRLWVLPVTALLSDNCYQTLQQQLSAVGIVFDTL